MLHLTAAGSFTSHQQLLACLVEAGYLYEKKLCTVMLQLCSSSASKQCLSSDGLQLSFDIGLLTRASSALAAPRAACPGLSAAAASSLLASSQCNIVCWLFLACLSLLLLCAGRAVTTCMAATVAPLHCCLLRTGWRHPPGMAGWAWQLPPTSQCIQRGPQQDPQVAAACQLLSRLCASGRALLALLRTAVSHNLGLRGSACLMCGPCNLSSLLALSGCLPTERH